VIFASKFCIGLLAAGMEPGHDGCANHARLSTGYGDAAI
jgi:hypothetical protein